MPNTTGRIFTLNYQDGAAVFSIDPIELIVGELPKRQQRLVEAWADLHQVELLADWDSLQAGFRPLSIEPLK